MQCRSSCSILDVSLLFYVVVKSINKYLRRTLRSRCYSQWTILKETFSKLSVNHVIQNENSYVKVIFSQKLHPSQIFLHLIFSCIVIENKGTELDIQYSIAHLFTASTFNAICGPSYERKCYYTTAICLVSSSFTHICRKVNCCLCRLRNSEKVVKITLFVVRHFRAHQQEGASECSSAQWSLFPYRRFVFKQRGTAIGESVWKFIHTLNVPSILRPLSCI